MNTEWLRKKPFYLNDDQIQWVVQTLNSLSTEQKMRQMFCSIAYSDDPGYLDMQIQAGFGGLMCRCMPNDQLVNLVSYLQSHAQIPFLIAGNMEAGMNQCSDTGTLVGCQMAIAATDDVHYAGELGRIIGEEAQALGMNYSFAPVIDIDNNWRNPITNTRTYGSDPKRVAAMGEAYVTELQKHGVATSIKHFPGDGVDERDQHLVTSINSLSVEEWESTYGEAYRRCIDAGAMTVMAGYIMQPAMTRKFNPDIRDEDLMPGPLQKELLQDLLRGQLGFNGMVITDSSGMAGFGCAMARSKAIPACINAGCDMILFTKNMEEDFQFLRTAIENGVVTLDRVDEAVTRILAVKAALHLPEKQAAGKLIPSLERANAVVGCAEHRAVAAEVANKAITLVKEEKNLFPITPARYPRVLVYPKEAGATDLAFGAASRVNQFVSRLTAEGFQVEVYQPSPGFEGLSAPMSSVIDHYDLLIYVANYATKSNQTVVRLEWAQPMGADCPIFINDVPTMFISLENPYHLVDAPRVRTYINTYGSSDQTLDALMDKLTGRSEFEGRSPVDAFCGFWDAHL